MEELARAIVDTVYLVKALFIALGNGDGNVAAQDQGMLWGSISSIVHNVLGFLAELFGEITAIL